MTEKDFIEAVAKNPGDDALRAAYADWLIERGDPRGEYLALILKIKGENKIDEETKKDVDHYANELANVIKQIRVLINQNQHGFIHNQQYIELSKQKDELIKFLKPYNNVIKAKNTENREKAIELAADIDPKWLALVSNMGVDNCGKTEGGWRMNFLCADRTWDEMQPTDDPKVRLCGGCNKNVHYCETVADIRQHSYQHNCCAIDLAIEKSKDLQPKYALFGNPGFTSQRENWENEPLDSVSRKRLSLRMFSDKIKEHKRTPVTWVQHVEEKIINKKNPITKTRTSYTSVDGVYRLEKRESFWLVSYLHNGNWERWRSDKNVGYFGILEECKNPDGTYSGCV